MKIKCPQCSYTNLKGSEFCQECGHKLNLREIEATKKNKTRIATSLHEEIEKIEDVIFKPTRKKNPIKKIFLWVLIVSSVGFLSLILLASLPGEESDITTNQTETETFPISYLNITDHEIIYDDYDESYFVGTLKNTYSKAARNVKVRLDFYYDEAMKRHFDTRNAIIEKGAEASGAFSFEVPINFYPQDQYWWIWKIESADYDL